MKEQIEMNNTLEGISSRITDAEEWINDLENRMEEITAIEQNIEKGMEKKKNEDSLRDSGTTLNTPNSHYSSPRRKERKDLRKYLKK